LFDVQQQPAHSLYVSHSQCGNAGFGWFFYWAMLVGVNAQEQRHPGHRKRIGTVGNFLCLRGRVKGFVARHFSMLVVLLLCVLIGCNDGGRRGITPGSRAPEIAGLSLAREPLSLSDIKGKVTVVNFWASWCPPCIAELPALQNLYDALRDQGIQVVGIAVDDTIEDIAALAAQYKLTFPIIVDTKAMSRRLYEIKGLPETFVLDEKQQVMLVIDPEEKTPVTRIIGPRPWGEASVVRLFSELLTKP
jgi:thiol-disulfide isomerase/thioredoxin